MGYCILRVDQRAMQHLFIKLYVMPSSDPMIELGSALRHYPVDLSSLYFCGPHIKLHGLINSPEQPSPVERLE